MITRKSHQLSEDARDRSAKFRFFGVLAAVLFVIASCEKNNVSNTPAISLQYFGPEFVKMSLDTVFLQFSFTDGNADLGNDSTSKKYDIYIKDFRYDTGFVGYYFPSIDKSIEDAKKGLSGTCLFEFFAPQILNARTDSVHTKFGDTTHFEFYIMDRAGNTSNHITTGTVIMFP